MDANPAAPRGFPWLAVVLALMAMLAAVLVLSALSGDEERAPVLDRLIVAQGRDEGSPWQAVAYGPTDKPCLEVLAGGSAGQPKQDCWSRRRAGEMVGPPVVARHASLVVLGIPVDERVVQVAFRFADGSTSAAASVGATGFRSSFVLVPLRPGRTVASMRFLDSNGATRWTVTCPGEPSPLLLPDGCTSGPGRRA